jgi:hypothetical protein
MEALMFAGEETVFPIVRDATLTWELCARAVLGLWPQAVFQDAHNAEVFRNFASIPFHRMSEMMIYRDPDAFQSWEELGADESNRNTMVHVLLSKPSGTPRQALVVVLDDASSVESVRILHALASVLQSTASVA